MSRDARRAAGGHSDAMVGQATLEYLMISAAIVSAIVVGITLIASQGCPTEGLLNMAIDQIP